MFFAALKELENWCSQCWKREAVMTYDNMATKTHLHIVCDTNSKDQVSSSIGFPRLWKTRKIHSTNLCVLIDSVRSNAKAILVIPTSWTGRSTKLRTTLLCVLSSEHCSPWSLLRPFYCKARCMTALFTEFCEMSITEVRLLMMSTFDWAIIFQHL